MKVREKRNRKKKFIHGFLALCGLIIVVLTLGIVLFPEAPLPDIVSEDFCKRNSIQFDTTSIEQIYLYPESILENPEQFLQEDAAYQMFARHRERVNDPFSTKSWLKKIERLAGQPEEHRRQEIPYRLYEMILKSQQSFCKEIAENVLTTLPEGTDLAVTVYLTAHERSVAAFTSQGKIAFSLSHPLLANMAFVYESTGLSAFFNLAMHEFFHIGFANSSVHPTEEQLMNNEIVVDVLYVLQNEGMATYLSYKMLPEYPTPFEWFTYLLDQKMIVRMYLNQINDILLDGSPAPPLGDEYNELYRRVGRVGYRWKGLYIVGGYMAMIIENELGHDALVQTVEDGFYGFAETYNALVDDDMQILWNEVP